MEKYKIIKKGYQIDFSKVDEGYMYGPETCVADSRNEARYILFNRRIIFSLKCSDDVTYTNIPVIRCKEVDLVEFEGHNITRNKIADLLKDRERSKMLDDLMEDETKQFFYIRKGGYYRPHSSGYTDMRHRAGVYDKKRAIKSARMCKDLVLIPINIEEHNKMIQDEIDDLETRLIVIPSSDDDMVRFENNGYIFQRKKIN